ncbi:MAG: hypothetical protein U1F31_13160 [Steroidobacteraceae bacterium]
MQLERAHAHLGFRRYSCLFVRTPYREAIKLTGASRNTLKQHFRALVERGTLAQHGSGRGVWYGLH